ncbi:MAG: hypothetical protein II942_01590 [Alphaproteobacteria bacterium]|nr:hypothetical protein [Alphaproteobacteria bacterium]
MRQLKLVFVFLVMLGTALPSHALSSAWPIKHGFFNIGLLTDYIGALLEYAVSAAGEKLKKLEIDASAGSDQLEKNIGMQQDRGHCGRSATGNTGCDLTTEEEGAAMAEEAEKAAMDVPDSAIKLIEDKEKVSLESVQTEIAKIAFAQDGAEANKDCKCADGTADQCDPIECAKARQNEELATATSSAIAEADAFFGQMDTEYKELNELVSSLNGMTTLREFIAGMGDLSVYASQRVPTIILLQSKDLTAQSYRNLATEGTEEVELSEEITGGSDDDKK